MHHALIPNRMHPSSTPLRTSLSTQTPTSMLSNDDSTLDPNTLDHHDIKELTNIPDQGLAREYLATNQHDIGSTIANEHADCDGIIFVKRYPYGGTELTDVFGSAVGVESVLPSFFEPLRKEHPEDVAELLDMPYLYPDAVTVLLVHPDGRAEYGSIPRNELPSQGHTNAKEERVG